MATLKYRKSRKNKKQLKKKKRTYKKRKTTRRKKGGTDDENIEDEGYKIHHLGNGNVKYSFKDKEGRIVYVNTLREYHEYNEPNNYDPDFDNLSIIEETYKSNNLDNLTTRFTTAITIKEQLKLLKQIVKPGKISCSGIFTSKYSENYVSCQKKKVHDYCTIIKKVDEILNTKLHGDHWTKFNDYKNDLEKKIEEHAKEAGIKSFNLDWICDTAKQKLKQEQEQEQEQKQEQEQEQKQEQEP